MQRSNYMRKRIKKIKQVQNNVVDATPIYAAAVPTNIFTMFRQIFHRACV